MPGTVFDAFPPAHTSVTRAVGTGTYAGCKCGRDTFTFFTHEESFSVDRAEGSKLIFERKWLKPVGTAFLPELGEATAFKT